jgi:hypothetical protein
VEIFPLFPAQIICLLVLVGIISAQPLPGIELKQFFPNLKICRLVCFRRIVKNFDDVNQFLW